MLSRRVPSVLSLLVVLTTAFGAVACRHKASDSLDAASDAASGADATNDASSAATGEGTIPSDAGAPTIVPSQAAPLFPRPPQFSGTYRCFKGMELVQAGNIVMSTMHKDATTDTVVACTAVGDACTGTVRDIQPGKGKASKKVVNVRPVVLQRTAGGDILFTLTPNVSASPGAKTSGSRTASPSKSSKSAAGDQTFCPRR